MKTQIRKYFRTDDDEYEEEYKIIPETENPEVLNAKPEPKGILGVNNLYFLLIAGIVLIGLAFLIFYKDEPSPPPVV